MTHAVRNSFYFTANGVLSPPLSVRIASVDGDVIVLEDMILSLDKGILSTDAQF